MIKLAMIGAGGYAYELIKRIWEIPEKIELVAVSSHPARNSAGRTACLEHGIPIYADVEGLLGTAGWPNGSRLCRGVTCQG